MISRKLGLVRHLIGDDNLYSECFRFICKGKSSVRLAQVILPSGMKEQVVSLVEDYYANEPRRQELGIEEFFDYGTGLSLLFTGPSGTGKTMLAKAIANNFDRQLFELRLDEMREMDSSIDEVLKSVFQEASLQGGIVFIDECDDLFRDDSSSSRALLIELEKSRCVTILATNKPINLDPALERRLSMRLKFTLPDAELRTKIWQALIPKNVSLAMDVDLQNLATTYAFCGGLIKNTIFMAVNSAMGKAAGKTPVITGDMLRSAVEVQSIKMNDGFGLYSVTSPHNRIADLPLRKMEIERLAGAAIAYERLQTEGMGLAILIEGADIETGVHTAEALAARCALKVKKCDLFKLYTFDTTSRFRIPETQHQVGALEYALFSLRGEPMLTLMVDYQGLFAKSSKDDAKGAWGMSLVLDYLRSQTGLFCLITTPGKKKLPLEFNLVITLSCPPEEMQVRRWEKHLGKGNEAVITLVERWPMHLAEIDVIARHATIRAIIDGRPGQPTIADVMTVIEARQSRKTVTLFGGDTKG